MRIMVGYGGPARGQVRKLLRSSRGVFTCGTTRGEHAFTCAPHAKTTSARWTQQSHSLVCHGTRSFDAGIETGYWLRVRPGFSVG